MTNFREQMIALKKLRDEEHRAKKALTDAEMKFRSEFGHLFTWEREAREERIALEQSIRSAARLEFLQWGDKSPAPGLGIRINRKLRYEEKDAFRWAVQEKKSDLLTLDRKKFEGIALKSSLPFPVEEVDDPVVTIATNLFSAFQEAERKAKALV